MNCLRYKLRWWRWFLCDVASPIGNPAYQHLDRESKEIIAQRWAEKQPKMTPVSPWSLRPRHILAFAEPLLFWLARAFAWLHRESQFARAHFGESGIQRHWREQNEQVDALERMAR